MSRTAVVVPKRLTSRRTYQTNSYQLELFTCAAPPQTDLFLHEEQPTISLNYTPDSFSIPPDYQPPNGKRILLTIPCAGKKPYSLSRTHSIVDAKLQTAFGENQRAIHKITFSGLYGPVPEEFESEEAVIRYEFQLSPRHTDQIQLCADRFNTYLPRRTGGTL